MGEQILFVGNNTNKEFHGVSGENGEFIIYLEGGDVYDIKIKSVGEVKDYSTVEIPSLGEGESYNEALLILKFESPKTFTLDHVHFDSGKSTLKKDSYIELNEFVEYLKYKKKIRIEIGGHTDNVGDEQRNLLLSKKRSDTVKEYLRSKGISTKRIISKGYGDSRPIGDNLKSEGRSINRRTEVKLLVD